MATELAKAYVQIVPTTKGIKNSISKEMNDELSSAGDSGGSSYGSALVGKVKSLLVGAGIGKILTDTLEAGGALQQSFGGLETIYGDAAEAAKEYARSAAQVGVSMNDYAEQAVSFGAALKQAYEGDTAKAIEAANIAILDMTDNAAKMGTPLESIQNAYQGFAKQNYTMLDNLKLGYGGTKTEMERLLADAQELSGVEYNIENLGDVYSAIHVIQEDLGLTGVAAYEAGETFTGSFNAMKSAAQNLLADLATGGDVQTSISALLSSVGTFALDNLLPMLKNIVSAIPGVLETLFTETAPELMNQGLSIITSIKDGFANNLPVLLDEALPMLVELSGSLRENFGTIVDAGMDLLLSLAQGIADSLPTLIKNVPTIVSNIANCINDNMPKILKTAGEIIKTLAKGLVASIPTIIENMPKIIAAIWDTITAINWINLGSKVINGIISGIKKLAGSLGTAAKEVGQKILTTIKNIDWKGLGKNILTGIKNGITSAVSSVVQAAKEAASAIFDAVKGFFKIGSPSKLMRDEIGKWIPAGVAVGITANSEMVDDAINKSMEAAISPYTGYDYSSLLDVVVPNQGDDSAIDSVLYALDETSDKIIDALEKLTVKATIGRDELFDSVRQSAKDYHDQMNRYAFL